MSLFSVNFQESKVVFSIGHQSFTLDYYPSDDPGATADQQRQWMAAQLNTALSRLVKKAQHQKIADLQQQLELERNAATHQIVFLGEQVQELQRHLKAVKAAEKLRDEQSVRFGKLVSDWEFKLRELEQENERLKASVSLFLEFRSEISTLIGDELWDEAEQLTSEGE